MKLAHVVVVKNINNVVESKKALHKAFFIIMRIYYVIY